eukprot:TRINITY_DN776236_c0_g1_i1.p1 TRINITY_DN776236_c0_g1~~TRINITY_DN776236_c0_g1_i1.p1  ORF type:complete len:168 (-),score=25.13 TRINITY_DN776236_c0_g1_i1:264-767(-)
MFQKDKAFICCLVLLCVFGQAFGQKQCTKTGTVTTYEAQTSFSKRMVRPGEVFNITISSNFEGYKFQPRTTGIYAISAVDAWLKPVQVVQKATVDFCHDVIGKEKGIHKGAVCPISLKKLEWEISINAPMFWTKYNNFEFKYQIMDEITDEEIVCVVDWFQVNYKYE